MKTTDFKSTISSAKLIENLEKQFNTRVNLNKYDREQLEDMRNKLRTRIFQQEGAAKFNDLLTNETYQKDKAMLELLNTRIKEMLGEQMQKLRDRMDQLSEGKKSAKPDFLDLDKDGNKKEPMKKAAKDAKVKEAVKKDKKELEGNAFGKAVRDAKKDGVQPGEKIKVGGKEYDVKENFDGDRNADQDTASKFNKKKTSTGTVHTKKSKEFDKDSSDDGKKDTSHLQGMLGNAPKNATKGRVHKMKEGMKHPKDCDCKECMGTFEGKDEGKPGKNFAKIAKDAGKRYGSKAAGERVAGAVRAKLAKQGKLQESQFKHNVRFVNESLAFLLQEDEEGKAKTITAASDMVNDFTGWMQRVGQYQTKAMIELADSIRADFGAAEAEAFKQAVAPALSATLDTLTQQRETISNAVASLAGESMPENPMGQEPGMDVGDNGALPGSEPDAMNPEMGADAGGDEFGASDAAAGGDVTAGRELRESREARRARRLQEAHSIIAKLAK